MASLRPHRLALPLVLLTYGLLIFGSTVRVHGAGLACPDWPLCFGLLVPAYDFKVYLEFGHRVVAGVVSLCFVGLAALCWRDGLFKQVAGLGRWFALAALALGVQVILGGLTVLKLLAEWTVSSHLLTGNTFCCLLLMIALTLRSHASDPDGRQAGEGGAFGLPQVAALLAVTVVPMQIVLGGLVSSSHAGLACGTWPGCNGDAWFPTFSGLVGLQVTHRLMAYTVAAVVLGSAMVQRGSARRPAWIAVGLVLLQVVLGVLNVFWQLPAEVTLAHSAGAAALWLCCSWTAFVSVRGSVPVSDALPSGAGLSAAGAK